MGTGTSLRLFFFKVREEAQIPIALTSNKKNSKENNSCMSGNVNINGMHCSPKLSITWKAEGLIFFFCDPNTHKVYPKACLGGMLEDKEPR